MELKELARQQAVTKKYLCELSQRPANCPEMYFSNQKLNTITEDLTWLEKQYLALDKNNEPHPVNGELEKIRSFNDDQKIEGDYDLLFIYVRNLLETERLKKIQKNLYLSCPQAKHLLGIVEYNLRPLSCLTHHQSSIQRVITFFPLNQEEHLKQGLGKLRIVSEKPNNLIDTWLAYLAPTWLKEILVEFPNLAPRLPVSV